MRADGACAEVAAVADDVPDMGNFPDGDRAGLARAPVVPPSRDERAGDDAGPATAEDGEDVFLTRLFASAEARPAPDTRSVLDCLRSCPGAASRSLLSFASAEKATRPRERLEGEPRPAVEEPAVEDGFLSLSRLTVTFGTSFVRFALGFGASRTSSDRDGSSASTCKNSAELFATDEGAVLRRMSADCFTVPVKKPSGTVGACSSGSGSITADPDASINGSGSDVVNTTCGRADSRLVETAWCVG
mmetsp:Transcript_33431/g.89446  ORF Transcript_33431/g.89446 Transcript_33431/m.89446 type:complete len:246 (+) Transcript_33431:599-1336(+)